MMRIIKKYFPFILIIMLMGAVLAVFLLNSERTMQAGIEDFVPPENTLIDKIIISQHENVVILEKTDDQWYVNKSGQAKTDRVKLLMESIRRLELVAPASKINRAALMDLMPAKGRKIELFQKNNLIRSFYVYFDSIEGTCMMKHPSGIPLVVKLKGYAVKNLLEIFSVTPGNYFENALFGYKPDDIVEIRIEYPDQPSHSFVIKRNVNGIPELSDLQNQQAFTDIDQQEVADYLSFFSQVTFNDTHRSLAEYMTMQQPFASLVVKTRNGTDTDLKAYRYQQPSCSRGDFDKNRYIAIIRYGQDTILLNYTDTDPIFRQIGDFQKK